jgi:antitoxin ParD1/3/4
MSSTTSINLGEYFTNFLAQLTAKRRYGSVSEAVRAALRLLEQEEAKHTILMQALEEGETSGESHRSWEELVGEAKARVKARIDVV